MFRFIKRMFTVIRTFVDCGASILLNSLECVSMSNQVCKVRPAIVNINSNEALFYRYNVL